MTEDDHSRFLSDWDKQIAAAKVLLSTVSFGEQTYLWTAAGRLTDADGDFDHAAVDRHLDGNRASSRDALVAKGLVVPRADRYHIPAAVLWVVRGEIERDNRTMPARASVLPPSFDFSVIDELDRQTRDARAEREAHIQADVEELRRPKVRPVRLVLATVLVVLLVCAVYLSPKDPKTFWDGALNAQVLGGVVATVIVTGGIYAFVRFTRR